MSYEKAYHEREINNDTTADTQRTLGHISGYEAEIARVKQEQLDVSSFTDQEFGRVWASSGLAVDGQNGSLVDWALIELAGRRFGNSMPENVVNSSEHLLL